MTSSKILFPTTDEELGKLLVDSIKQKKIVVFPLETCYGICFDLMDEGCKKRAYEIKKRPPNMKFPGVISSKKKLDMLGIVPTRLEKIFMEKYWPGQLTIAFTENFAAATPTGEWFIKILNKINTVICGTSANVHGKTPVTKYKDLDSEIIENVDLVIIDDSKNIHDQISTIVRLKDKVEIIRQGVLDVSDWDDKLK